MRASGRTTVAAESQWQADSCSREPVTMAFCCSCLPVAGQVAGSTCIDLLQLPFGDTIYLIKVRYRLFQCWFVSESPCRVSSLTQSIHRTSTLDLRSSPMETISHGLRRILTRRPVLHSAHLTHRMRSGPVLLSLLAFALKSLQTPLLQHPAGTSSPFRTVAPLLLRLVPPPQRCKIHSPVLDRAPILMNLITLPLPLTTVISPR